jgi:hypothetical protein
MNNYRKNAICAGLLWIIGTAAFIMSFPFLKIVGKPDFLVYMSQNATYVTTGVVFILITAISCGCIAVFLFPVLKKHNEALAVGAVGFRFVEVVSYIILMISLMSLLTLSKTYVKAMPADVSSYQVSGALLMAVNKWTTDVFILIPFGIGALMYYIIFYKSKLIPRWLSGWGIVAVLIHMATSLLVMFDVIDSQLTIHTALNMPIALQEIAIAVWLIVKGFNSSAIAQGPIGNK